MKLFIKILSSITCLALLAIGGLYAFTRLYDFPESQPFSGDQLYNPYLGIAGVDPLKCNWHAHTTAWGGLTNGHDSGPEMIAAYTGRGYDITGISNYHDIDEHLKHTNRLYMPNYEHGYNVFKAHKLALNAARVSYLDFPLFQLPSHKQHILELLNDNGATPIIAHPEFLHGHSLYDLKHLVNYSLLEVLNHYRISDKSWDVALSAGHPVYVNASDDTHDLVKELTFQRFTMVFSPEKSVDAVLSAMTTGAAYGVDAWAGQQSLFLVRSREIANGFVHYFQEPAGRITVIGQDGKVLQQTLNADSVRYQFSPTDTYARVFAEGKTSALYLNPVFRYAGAAVPTNYAPALRVNYFKTGIFRIAVFLVCGGILWRWTLIIKR
ncbi:MAG: hypothetical protein DA408_02590 [Bacteroidetes bacterium]|nr:MAG: hypothetical protein C7N36_17845 [Bacteroidota bacterium]PTM14489.1 MAG: hypothetical protein DA408_02590 [Bacteroidota bacterium]